MHHQLAAGLVTLILIFGVPAAGAYAEPPATNAAPPEVTARELPISVERVREHIEYLASPKLQGRREGEGKRLAAEYLIQHYKKLKLQPVFENQTYIQEIPGQRGADGSSSILGVNIGAWLPGSDPELRDEVVIVSAHYDHLGVRNGQIYPGADDNASGVAMVLEVARAFATAKNPPRRSIAFINFDLEEHMLWGSRWFAAHPPWPLEQVKLFITADLIGRSLGDLPFPVVFALGSESGTSLAAALGEVGSPPGLEVALLGADLVGTRSDYGPFRDRKVPFLFFSCGEHPDYHTPQDTADRVDIAKVARVSTVILGVMQLVASGTVTPEWQETVEPDVDEARTLHRITELLLAEAEERNFSGVQRMLVSHVHTRTGQIIKRGTMTGDERRWLIRSAQLLLFSVF